jgi:hypothetical protein
MEQRTGFDLNAFAARHSMQLLCSLQFKTVIMTDRAAGPAAAPLGSLHPEVIPTRGAPQYTPQY